MGVKLITVQIVVFYRFTVHNLQYTTQRKAKDSCNMYAIDLNSL